MTARASPRETDLAARLHSVAIHLLRRVRPADRAIALTAARLSALSVVVFGGPVGLRKLAEAEQVTPPTMSRIVSRLEGEGLVRRAPDPEDRRAVRIVSTARGRRLLEQGRARRLQLLNGVLEGLEHEERAVLTRAVKILERALSSKEGRG